MKYDIHSKESYSFTNLLLNVPYMIIIVSCLNENL